MSSSGDGPTKRQSNLPPLPRPVQEHLGQKLRAQYHETGDKPRYLGDPMVPVAFDPLLDRIDRTERQRKAEKIGKMGTLAVAQALQEVAEELATDGHPPPLRPDALLAPKK